MKKIITLVSGIIVSVLIGFGIKSSSARVVTDEVSRMTLDEKIAQMFIIKFSDEEVLKKELKLKPGGVIFFKENISSLEKTTDLIKYIKSTNSIPLFIAIDQEGGRVQRLNSEVDAKIKDIPDARTIGDTQDYDYAYSLGKYTGALLKNYGFNMDNAPVVDVVTDVQKNAIGNRSFSADPVIVAKMAEAFRKGLEEEKVVSVIKHFPGHGASNVDSHEELPVINKSREELYNSDLIPFKYLIERGVSTIMVGHLGVLSLTNSNIPASLSKTIIKDMLRDELNYTGVVITDSLQMKAIKDNFTEQETYELAINAGVDILLMPNSASSAINLIKKSINEGKITEEQIDTAVKRILKLKKEKL